MLAAIILALSLNLSFYLFTFPKDLKNKSATQSSLITDRNGVPLREHLSALGGRGRWVSLQQISPRIIDAIVTAEDKRFYSHNGIDLAAIIRAAILNIKTGQVVSGGSTITQQLARLIKPRKRTFVAKLIEAATALRIELSLSKDEILEQYLNRVLFGNQLFGVEAASQMYFDKPAQDISTVEAAYLAILPRAPSVFNPYNNPQKIDRLQQELIARLYEEKKITKTEMENAQKTGLKFAPKRWAFRAPHFVEMLKDVEQTLTTSLDIDLQEKTEKIVAAHLTTLKKDNVTNAAAVIVNNETGEVLALVGSADYHDNKTAGNVNGVSAMRQPGSALKPFTYALALERGYTAATIIPDIETHFSTPGGDYVPQNYNRKFNGPVRLRTALANSLNVSAVHTVSQIGENALLYKLREAGFKSLNKGASYYGLGLTLGNGEVTLLELATAYSMLARGGTYIPLSLIPTRSVDSGKRIFSKEVAYIISDILSDDDARRMSFGEGSPLRLPFKVAAKTGTTKNFRDNWTVGYTPEITVAVWAGNFDGSEMKGVSGVTGAAPIFKDIFKMLSKKIELSWFAEPNRIVHKNICPLSGKLVDVPGSIGAERKLSRKSASEYTSPLEMSIDEIFIQGTEPKKKCDFHVERKVDTRNDLLASENCNSRWCAEKTFIELPHKYKNWAKEKNIILAPVSYSPLCPRQIDSNVQIGKVQIIHPKNNSTYAIDPNIPRRLQTLYMETDASGPVSWFVDGREITASSLGSAVWPLEPGNHKIKLTARNAPSSDEITITVH